MIKTILTLVLCLFTITLQSSKNKHKLPEFLTAKYPTKELVYQYAKHYGIKHPKIVVAQSILETGHYKSKLCKQHNNLFGLYDSKNRRFYKFKTWQESVRAYKQKVQYKYKSGDYYAFLKRINYAEDPKYITKLKRLT